MERYLIAVDMDGTLLNSQNEITEKTLAELQRVLDQGHVIVPASGRAPGLLPEALRTLQTIEYAITENGAFVWDFRQGTALYQECMQENIVRRILKETEELDCYVEVFAGGNAYAEAKTVRKLVQSNKTSLGPLFIAYMKANHFYVSRLLEENELLRAAEKVNVYFEYAEEGEAFRAAWKQEAERANVAVTTSISGNIEFNAAGVNKGTALCYLAKRLEIPKERCIAFGDNENDLEMFEAVGTAVAMENAAHWIRERATVIAPDHDRDGVAKILHEFLKKELKNR